MPSLPLISISPPDILGALISWLAWMWSPRIVLAIILPPCISVTPAFCQGLGSVACSVHSSSISLAIMQLASQYPVNLSLTCRETWPDSGAVKNMCCRVPLSILLPSKLPDWLPMPCAPINAPDLIVLANPQLDVISSTSSCAPQRQAWVCAEKQYRRPLVTLTFAIRGDHQRSFLFNELLA